MERCPTTNFYFDDAAENKGLEALKRELICKVDVKLDRITRLEQIRKLVDQEKCARWYLNSTSLFRRCLPYKVWDGFLDKTITDPELRQARKLVGKVDEIEDFLKKAYQDFKTTK